MNDLPIGDGAHIPAAKNGAYPVRGGNSVRPLIDGEPAFRRICSAVDSARSRVWVTVAYYDPALRMPGDRGGFFDVLDRAAARGVDVRVLFWREPRLREIEPGSKHFSGTAAEQRWLTQRRSGIKARWDRLPSAYCQHQKSWLVDAGQPGEVVFVGGINLDPASISSPGHLAREIPHIHDLYVELAGPAATDVHHGFVQRWNEASERGNVRGGAGVWPNAHVVDDLEFPATVSPASGSVTAQVTRTVMPDRYTDDTATPGGARFAIRGGETSVLEQYMASIASAASSIYIENQVIGSVAVVEALQAAVERGVAVVFVVPGDPHPAFLEARRNPRSRSFFEKLSRLGRSDLFTLAAISCNRESGGYQEIYVHAKIAIVDDAWATIGSTNIAERSFHRDTELNVSFWHNDTARTLRDRLLKEHLGRDTSSLGAREALALFEEVALANRERRQKREPQEGLAYALDADTYGVVVNV